jgi:hypothetical protein
MNVKFPCIIQFLQIPCCRRKHTGSLCIFSKIAPFHLTYLPKPCNSAYFLNTLHTANSAQFYSVFLLTTISLTACCRRKHEVWLHAFAKDAQNDYKTYSYKDNGKFIFAFFFHDNAKLCYTLLVKTGVIEKF